ncbi:XopAC/AvrAC family type III secretion system effector [Paracidovorax cattleyae]|nr:XopAC/AvrAC family type III secretion system effector [Paracidovorax cattleyae]
MRALRQWRGAGPEHVPRGGFWARMAVRLARPAAVRPLPGGFDELREEAVDRVLEAHAERSCTLDLSGLALSELPPGLERLEFLEALDVSDNTGLYRLPDALAHCRALRFLAARNSFVTEVPAALFALPQLETLDLSANFDLGNLPDSLAQATRLRELRLSHCRFTAIPAAAAQLPALAFVDLSCNPRLHALPGGRLAMPGRVVLDGTPAALTAELLRAPPWTPAERRALGACLRYIAGGASGRGLPVQEGPRLALFLSERVDGTATAASWRDAARTVDTWVAEGRPFTPQALLELGWIANGRAPGEPRLRTHEIQRVPAGRGPLPCRESDPRAVAAPPGFDHRSYPPARALPGHLAEVTVHLEARLAGGDPLAAVEVAALLHQAFMSLRPLPSGNASAALLAMDWALLRQGLPPMRLPGREERLHAAVVFAGGRPARARGMEDLVRQVMRGLAHWREPACAVAA